VEAGIFDRASLGAGDRFEGPAIVTQLDATTLVARGWQAEVMPAGALMLRRR
jgi:N-methylhydantoinase A